MLGLPGAVDNRDHVIDQLRSRVSSLEEELNRERAKNSSPQQGLIAVREILAPMYRGLQLLFGEIDAMDLKGSAAPAMDDRVAKAWDHWKSRLGGSCGKAIDALMLHGSMTQTQLRIAMGCAAATCSNTVSALNKAGLINKRDGKISLKEL